LALGSNHHSALPPQWTRVTLGDVANIKASNVDKVVDSGEQSIRLCNYTDVYYNSYLTDRLAYAIGSATDKELSSFRLLEGDVVITKDSEDRFDIGVPALVAEPLKNVVCGYHLTILRPKPGVACGGFLLAALQDRIAREYFATVANGVTRFGLGAEQISALPLALPTIGEQHLIFSIQHTWDRAIAQTTALLAAKERLKAGLMQQLFTKQTRTRSVRLGDVFKERREPGNDGLPTLSVTLEFGVVRRDSLGKPVRTSLEHNEHLLVRRGDLTYNMMRMWQGGSGMALEDGVVSPAYVVCAPTMEIDSRFAHHLFRFPAMVHQFWAYSFGLTDDRRRLYFDEFARIPVSLPPVPEQKRIAGAIDCLDTERALLLRRRETLAKQKRGLMQRLLTGEVRVPKSLLREGAKR